MTLDSSLIKLPSLLSIGLLFFSSCSQAPQMSQDISQVVEHLKPKYGDYRLSEHSNPQGQFPGYALRFVNQVEFNHHADFFVYPVPQNIAELSHKQIVAKATQGSIQTIHNQVKNGHYDQVKVLSQETMEMEFHSISMVKMLIIEKGISSLSYLFITEDNGELLCSRVSLLDVKEMRNRTDVAQNTKQIFMDLIEMKTEVF